jgi:hypothetical protein
MNEGKILYLFIFLVGMLLFPSLGYANSTNSENYEIVDQGDFGGNVSNSENYQVFGMLTDMGQVVFWPQVSADDGGGEGGTPGEPEEGIPISLEPISEVENIIPTESEIGMFENIFDINIGNNSVLGTVARELNIPLATAGVALTFFIALVSQLFGGVAILSVMGNAWAWFLSLFSKKKEKYGVVYDAEANAPIARAVVQIFESEYEKLLSTQITDIDGRFLLMVDPGKYYIKVVKSNYDFPSKTTSDGYHGASFEVKERQELLYKIPMDPNHKVLVKRVSFLSGLVKFFNAIRLPIVVVGTVFSIIAFYQDQSTINLVIISLYVIVWMIELYKLRKTKPYGITKDKFENNLIDRVILRLFNDKNKLVSTQVSDSHGRYSFLTNPGSYSITAIKASYDQYKKSGIDFKKSGRVNIDIDMEKKKPKIKIVPTVLEPEPVTSENAKKIDDNMHPTWV